MLILALIGFGMLIGWIAQAILGMGVRPNGQSLAAGLIGSFVGGLIGSLLAGDGIKFRASGIIGSIVGAIIVLLIWNAYTRSQKAKLAVSKKDLRSGNPQKRAHPGAKK
ncbi:MAG TPA: GlsB/YeaQ/YmgE family stress response membrane protein [Ilumatobacteraceae bacterium]|nr:GlsB/YeaQ/YmgE family stress response membrane protein [Ilumatobacteraceae bacterium]